MTTPDNAAVRPSLLSTKFHRANAAASAGAPDAARRRAMAGMAAWVATPGIVGCTALAAPESAAWETRLRGNTIALLGEVHDNAELHRLRTAVLRRALRAGWRPAVVMEQFDVDRQTDIDRARSERPGDAAHLIKLAGATRGWDWRHYEPMLALVLEHKLPLHAGNLPRAVASRLVRETAPTVFGAERAAELGLDRAADPAWQAAQEHQIDQGHCRALPPTLLPGMARGQLARDAVMAEQLQRHAAHGAVLLAGNGHVRRDLGVPRWLDAARKNDVLVVGFIEAGEAQPSAASAFDAVLVAAPAPRADPCASFKPPPAG